MEKMKRESFVLNKLNLPNGTTRPIFLNSFSIEDDTWKSERFTEEQLKDALYLKNVDVFLQLLWRSMDDDAKRLIASAKLVVWNGLIEAPLEVQEPEQKLKHVIGSSKELINALKALIATLRNSAPDETFNEEKKSPAVGSSQTLKSSTLSPVNMDSQKNSLENSQGEKSVSL